MLFYGGQSSWNFQENERHYCNTSSRYTADEEGAYQLLGFGRGFIEI